MTAAPIPGLESTTISAEFDMSILRFRPMSRRHAWLVGSALLLATGCRDATSPPLDPSLTGRWLQSGLDTYAQFVLEKRGSRVTGTFASGLVSVVPNPHAVSGTATLDHVVLKWKSENYRFTFDATLPSTNSNELIGIMAVDGEPFASPTTFHRVTSP